MNLTFDDIILSHPHDYFRVNQLGTTPGNCFVLMPFAKEFRLIYQTIEESLKGLMVCTRADDLRLGKPILARILHGIGTAELIIADLTEGNANVYYELGLAHTRTKNVLLLTRNIDDVPFDLQGLFCHAYSTNSREDFEELGRIVRRAAEDVRAQTLPKMLEGAMSRTRNIVAYMKQQLNSPKTPRGLAMRVQASISSIGNISRAALSESDRRDYSECLEEEGKLMIRLIEEGASLRVVISPYLSSVGSMETNDERKARLDRLIEFIAKREDCMERTQFAVSPTVGANLLFFGEDVLFEGHKTEVQRGFGWTLIYTDKDFLTTRVQIFDRLFESCRLYTINNYSNGRVFDNDNEALRQTVLTALHDARGPLE